MIQIALNAVVSTLSTIFWAKTSLMNKILGCFAWWLHILNLITFHLNHLSINYEILVPLSFMHFSRIYQTPPTFLILMVPNTVIAI